MGLLSKKEASIQQLKAHIELFTCPHCRANMTITERGTITCAHNHSFDIAKQGYVNFMTKQAPTMYSKQLFEARQQVIASGLYDPLQQAIAHMLKEHETILDTGCGEGSHLVRICERAQHATGVGIDIAKEGITTAAKFYNDQIWAVGDLAHSPFQQECFTTILNILSPANYEEFKRLLQPQGQVIKVVPQEGYLQELRQQAFAQSEKEQYTNNQTVARFHESFPNVQTTRLTYTVEVAEELVPLLLQMTPMGWHIDNKHQIKLSAITIDVDILVGQL